MTIALVAGAQGEFLPFWAGINLSGGIKSDPVLATAVLDRLLHYSTTLNIKEESYRIKEKHRAGLLGNTQDSPDPEPEQEVPA